METLLESIVNAASGIPVAFAVLGALIAFAIAARLGLRSGIRYGLTAVAFVAVFVFSGGFASREAQPAESRDSGQSEAGIGTLLQALLDSLPSRGGGSEDEEEQKKNIPPPLWKYAGTATDGTGSALASFFGAALGELRHEPVVCVSFLYSVVHSRVPPQLSWRLDARFKKLTARVVEESERSPKARVDSLSAVALGRMMVARLRESHGERRAREILAIMSEPANGLSKPREVCDAASAIYATIADMPTPAGGKLMRYKLDRQTVAPARGAMTF